MISLVELFEVSKKAALLGAGIGAGLGLHHFYTGNWTNVGAQELGHTVVPAVAGGLTAVGAYKLGKVIKKRMDKKDVFSE